LWVLVYPSLSIGNLFCRNQTHYHIQLYWYGTAQLQGKHQTQLRCTYLGLRDMAQMMWLLKIFYSENCTQHLTEQLGSKVTFALIQGVPRTCSVCILCLVKKGMAVTYILLLLYCKVFTCRCILHAFQMHPVKTLTSITLQLSCTVNVMKTCLRYVHDVFEDFQLLLCT